MMFRILLFPALLLLPAVAADPVFPLRDVATRETLLLSDWRFQAVPQGREDEVDWSDDAHRAQRAEWPAVRLPAVWDQSPGEVTYPAPNQVGWFATEVEAPGASEGPLALWFMGVKYTADVFVNGEWRAVHRGGYTPFRVSVGDDIAPGESLEIVVRVDNRLSEETIPKHNTGWDTYGGITREVWLVRKPPARPVDLFVQTEREEDGAWALRLRASTEGVPEHPMRVRVARRGGLLNEGQIDDWADGIDITLPLGNPALWSPDSPALHDLELTWGDDRLTVPVGVRELAWRDGKLILNGEPVWLQGFGQHEFFPRAGPVLNTQQRRDDLEWMKNHFGANALRTGHYPQHPELFSLADEIGLLVFTEVPAWQVHPRILARDDVWETWLDPQITGMVLRFRNHPSVFGWGVLNEIGGAHTYITRARNRILELDPDRGVAAVIAAESDFRVNQLTDFAARNWHYGWYHSRSVYDLRDAVDRNLSRSNNLPIWVAELGGMARPGRLGGGYSDDVRGTETYQDKMTRFGLQYILSRADDLAGISLWTWSDYRRNGRAHDHGVLGPGREPKLAAYTALNLMRPRFRALALENETVIGAGEPFTADLAVFTHPPAPDTRMLLKWRVVRGQETFLQGEESVVLGDRLSTPAGRVAWTVPAGFEPGLAHLYLELQDEEGTRLHSQALPFEPGGTTRPGVLRIPPPASGTVYPLTVNGMTLDVHPHVGLLLPLAPGRQVITDGERERAFTIREARYREITWEE